MILALIAFVAGALTILAPCVLPVLPVIIGGSVGGDRTDKLRPYIIGGSLALSIIGFTLLLKVSTVLAGVPAGVLGWISGGILLALGLVTMFPGLWESLVLKFNLQAVSERWLRWSAHSRGRYTAPVLIGVALGPVFASCSPTYAYILASVLPSGLAAGVAYLAVYTLGLALALLAASLMGRRLMARFGWALDTHSVPRRLLGGLFVIVGIVIIGGWQLGIETWLANRLPFDETKLEQVLLSGRSTGGLKLAQASGSALNVEPVPAPELTGLTNWINSSPQTLAGLRGKVVLVDFWTYSCINCIRTLPYVEKWYQTYKDQGLVILGVNTPEFAFEHDPGNVAEAVKRDGITYPVALDNAYATWNAFNNDSWPADYLIDKSGNVRYVSKGEGDYDKTEAAIQELLGSKGPMQVGAVSVPYSTGQTGETYFGTNRAQGYTGEPSLSDGAANFSTATPPPGGWTLGGSWQVAGEQTTSNDDAATLTFHFAAKDVYVVAGSSDSLSHLMKVGLPGGLAGQAGRDVTSGVVNVTGSRLYHIVSLNKFGDGTVTLTVPKGVSLYTFTFGS